jgi:UDP-N-acetylmuramoyl-tripeptide--D-alanyl-D-alanine ligase
VLGDMLELGSYEVSGHERVGRTAATVVQELVTVGARARVIAEQAVRSGLKPETVHSVMSHEEAIALLLKLLRKGDLVLVKGSRGMAMENIVRALSEEPR